MKITKVVIGCFIACMALVTGIAHNHLFANTGRDISNNAVRSLSVNSSNILDGDKIRVDMDFDDQNGRYNQVILFELIGKVVGKLTF